MTISTKALSATVSAVSVPAHDETIYSQGFEGFSDGTANPDSWAAGTGSSSSVDKDDFAHTGTSALGIGRTSAGAASASRAFTGLVIGLSYTFSVYVGRVTASTMAAQISVVGIGSGSSFTPGGSGSMVLESYTFTATATSHTVTIQCTQTGAGSSLWDDILLVEHVPDTITDVTLDPDSGSVTLDQGWTPYGQGTLVIPLMPGLADSLDPRDYAPVTITPSQSQLNSDGWSDPVSRDIELLTVGRVIDHNAENITLTLETKERILQDAKLVATAPDLSLLPYQASVRDVCTQVLDRHSFTLEAGTADADFTTTKSAQNLHPDPACTAITYWHSASASTTMAQVAGSPNYVKGTPTSGSSVVVYIGYDGTNKLACQPGDVITVSADFDPTTVARNGIMSVRFFNAAGTQVGSDVSSGSVAYPFNAWTHASWTAVAPAGATGFTPFVNFSAVASSTAYVALRQGMILIGDTIDTDTVTKIPWFDGATATDDYYTYAWDGTANASSSTRTPRIDRTPDALTQQPGASEWDLLSTVLQQSALRLFCDELGVWRLVDGNYTVPGRVTIAEGFNAYQATDTISRDQQAGDGSPLWFDGCVIKYSWIDTTGVQQQAWDAYPLDDSATQVAYFEINGAFPGPGIAQYRVKSANGHGRTLALTAAVDYMATPGMEAVASLPGTEDQTGRVASVSWDFAADTMTVGTAGLTDTPDSAWIELDPGEEWLDSPVGGSWIGEAV